MENIINFFKEHSIVYTIIAILLIIVIYSMFSVLLNKLNNAKHGKTTALTWVIPINIYLLGSLVIHWVVGILLVLGLLFGIVITFNISGLESIHNILPNEYVLPYQIGYGVIILILFIAGKHQLNRIIREGTSKDSSNAFINKDYDNPEPDIVASKEQVTELKEMIEDNYQYNRTTLSSLNNHNNDDNKNS